MNGYLCYSVARMLLASCGTNFNVSVLWRNYSCWCSVARNLLASQPASQPDSQPASQPARKDIKDLKQLLEETTTPVRARSKEEVHDAQASATQIC